MPRTDWADTSDKFIIHGTNWHGSSNSQSWSSPP